MASPEELAVRVLRKLKVTGVSETPAAEDVAVVLEKISAAHYAMDVEGVLRWTLSDIPTRAEEPYVLMAAFLAADDFVVPKDPAWWLQGFRQAQAMAHIPLQAGSVTYSMDY